jgi:hypothetical protein
MNHMVVNLVGCKEICFFHKAKSNGKKRYSNNQKRCQTCEIFIKWEGLWCPCCGYMLRTHPRNSKSRKKSDLLKSRH